MNSGAFLASIRTQALTVATPAFSHCATPFIPLLSTLIGAENSIEVGARRLTGFQ